MGLIQQTTKIIWFVLGIFSVTVLYAASTEVNEISQPALPGMFESKIEKDLFGATAGQLTITGASTIRFLQAYFYSNTGCTTLLGFASVIDNGTGFVFTTGQTVNLNETSIFSLANNQGITMANVACMKLFVNGSNETPDGITCQSFSDMSCSGSTCTSSQTKAVTWAASPTFCATQYMYIVQQGTNTVDKCTVSAVDGTISSCAQTATAYTFTNPFYITVNNGFAYISDDGANTIVKCTVSASDGELSSCVDTGVSGVTTPEGITVNTQYIYTTDRHSSSQAIFKCTIDPSDSGSLSSCADTGSFNTGIRNIVINNGYAYITSTSSDNVTKCDVSTSDGTLSSCAATASSLNNPAPIAISNGYAYIGSNGNDNILKCDVNASTGALSSCAQALGSVTNPKGLVINNGYLYYADIADDDITKCDVSAVDGSLSSCTQIASSLSNPYGLAIY